MPTKREDHLAEIENGELKEMIMLTLRYASGGTEKTNPSGRDRVWRKVPRTEDTSSVLVAWRIRARTWCEMPLKARFRSEFALGGFIWNTLLQGPGLPGPK